MPDQSFVPHHLVPQPTVQEPTTSCRPLPPFLPTLRTPTSFRSSRPLAIDSGASCSRCLSFSMTTTMIGVWSLSRAMIGGLAAGLVIHLRHHQLPAWFPDLELVWSSRVVFWQVYVDHLHPLQLILHFRSRPRILVIMTPAFVTVVSMSVSQLQTPSVAASSGTIRRHHPSPISNRRSPRRGPRGLTSTGSPVIAQGSPVAPVGLAPARVLAHRLHQLLVPVPAQLRPTQKMLRSDAVTVNLASFLFF